MKPALSLLQQARDLNREVEQNVIGLGMVLLEINEQDAWRTKYDSFHQFCIEDLGRSKGFVTKLLVVSAFLKTHGYVEAKKVSMEKLYTAINAYPNRPPKQVLLASRNLTLSELEDERREVRHGVCTDHDPITICAKCHLRI